MSDFNKNSSSRRRLIQTITAATALAWWRGGRAFAAGLPFAGGERPLVQYPQKRPLLRLTSRPPQLETPLSVFNEGILTPNDAFFVRYHLAGIPTSIDPATYKLSVTGRVKKPLTLSLEELKKDFPATEIVAVNQCSGNSRGFSEPRVGGGQLGHGAMGNARWRGISLKDLLEHAGIEADAKEVTFRGLDKPILDTTPAFVKSLEIDHAMNGEVLLAYSMNGEDLPMLNGFPLRLVVPGYFGTYWVKHLSDIEVLAHEYSGFWMKSAYRLPDNACGCVEPGEKPKKTTPIKKFVIRSLITNIENGAAIPHGTPTFIKGIAFDAGSGIKSVSLSADGGRSWLETKLGDDLGPYSFRPWSIFVTLPKRGTYELMARATSNSGEIQPLNATWNPAGYRRNVVERVKVTVL